METLAGGRYVVLRKIASGGMADVFLCRLHGEEGFAKKVAVKVVRSHRSGNPRFRELFVREARIAATLSHPNVIQVFDFGRDGDRHYLAMEFLEGWNLSQAILQSRLRPVRIPVPVWRFWMEGILEGIGYLHRRKIVHRDISPSNVILSRNGSVKITDFGVARVSDREGDPDGVWQGKVPYFSPERARGEPADRDSDLFAAALIGAEMYLEAPLFGGDGPEAVLCRIREYRSGDPALENLPGNLRPVIAKALSPGREDRFENAGRFLEAIRGAVPDVPGRIEVARFWEELFPTNGKADEETADGSEPFGSGGALLVREPRGGYRSGTRWKHLFLGVSGVLAISGTALLVSTELRDDGFREGSATGSSREAEPWGDPRNPDGSGPGADGGKSGKAVGDPGSDVRTGVPPNAASDGAKPPVPVPGDPPKTGKVAPLRGSMEPAEKRLTKSVIVETVPSGVELAVEGGERLGFTPLSVDPSAVGNRRIVFRREGYRERSLSGTDLTSFSRFRMEMEPEFGILEAVQAIPWARVYDGERELGVTPLVSLKLSVGVHRLRFVNEPLGIDRVETVPVVPGRNPKLVVPLGKTEGNE